MLVNLGGGSENLEHMAEGERSGMKDSQHLTWRLNLIRNVRFLEPCVCSRALICRKNSAEGTNLSGDKEFCGAALV